MFRRDARRPPLHRSVQAALTATGTRFPALAAVWAPTFISRFAVLLIGYLAVITIGYSKPQAPWRISDNEALNLPARWDAGWYLHIAETGYTWSTDPNRQTHIVFFPAFPLLMRAGGWVLGAQPAVAGFLMVCAALPWALVYLYRLARDELTAEQAEAAVTLLAFYPFAVYFSAIYTEAQYLLGCVGAFYHLRRREYLRACCWGLLVGLTRPNGFLLSVPLAVIGAHHVFPKWTWLGEPRCERAGLRRPPPATLALALLTPAFGTLLYTGYVYQLTGDPFIWMRGHAAWGRVYQGVSQLVMDRYDYIAAQGLYGYTTSAPTDFMNTCAALFALALIWPVTRRLGLAYGVFMAVNLIPPLLAGGTLSMGRMTSVLFPMFLWLGLVVPATHRSHWSAAFAIGQGFIAALFFTWRPPY